MARARNIKPSFFTNDDLSEVHPLGRLLFIALWTMADREGRMEDRPKRIKAEALPYDDCDANELLDQLAERGFITRYTVGETRFIQVVNFCKHQNPHIKEGPSQIPAPDKPGASPVQARCKAPPKPEPTRLIPDSGFPLPDSPSLIPSSVPNGTDGDAVAPKSAADLTKDELWRAGKSLLAGAGMPDAQCGSFVGKLVRDYGNAVVVEVVRSAVVERPADPASFMVASCLARGGKRPKGKQASLESRNAEVAARWVPPELREVSNAV